MSKKSNTEVYDFDKETMRKQILTTYEKKSSSNKDFKFSLIPISLVIIFVGAFLIKNVTFSKIVYTRTSDASINVNEVIEEMSAFKQSSSEPKTETSNINLVWPNILKDGITLPKDLTKENGYAIYTKNSETGQYTDLNSYVYEYFNNSDKRKIRLAFSETEKPLRDYYFNTQNAKKSNINNYELVIFQYGDTFYTEFTYKEYNFDIETTNVTKTELTSLLKSILK